MAPSFFTVVTFAALSFAHHVQQKPAQGAAKALQVTQPASAPAATTSQAGTASSPLPLAFQSSAPAPSGAAPQASSSVSSQANPCDSYGVDFQEGGHYYQNNNSADPFTALQIFEGCQNDVADNILVDPSGNQKACSQTPMQPDNTTQLVTCQDDPKDTLYTGEWSLLIISNNGNAEPIAYQRDFYLQVGPAYTTTVYPTATASQGQNQIQSGTTSTTVTFTTTVPAVTITATPAAQRHGGHYEGWHNHQWQGHGPPQWGWHAHPPPSYVKTTKTLTTYTQTVTDFRFSASVHTTEAACTSAVPYLDKAAQILPSILGELDDVVTDVLGGSLLNSRNEEARAADAYKSAIIQGRNPTVEEKQAFVDERERRMAKNEKRSIDAATYTVTATTSPNIFTLPHAAPTTFTSYATTTYSTTVTVSSGTATVTGNAQAPEVTTHPAPTYTWTVYQPFAVEFTTTTQVEEISMVVTTTALDKWQKCAQATPGSY